MSEQTLDGLWDELPSASQSKAEPYKNHIVGTGFNQIMGKSQRSKGQRGELKACELLRRIFPAVTRDLNDVNEERGIDLKGTHKLAVQVKHYKKHVPFSKYKEIKPNSDEIAVLMSIPTDRKSIPMVALSVKDFLAILEDVGVVYDDYINPDTVQLEAG